MPPNISYLYSCFSINVQFNICRALAVQEVNKMIQFVILFSKQAKPRLQKWFQAYPEKVDQEGYIEELSTCFYLDTTLLKSSESVLSET